MSRGRAIVATPRLPWPVDDGGRVALMQSLRAIAVEWETTLVTMVGEGTDPPLPLELAALGVNVRRVPHAPRALPALLEGLAGPLPYTLARYRSRAYATALREEVARRAAELVVLHHLHMAPFEPAARPAAVVLRQHNVEHAWMTRYAGTLPPGPVRAYARLQAARLKTAERHWCERMDLVLAIQPEETGALRSLAPRARVELLPAAADFAGPRARPDWKPTVLVCGAWGWPPNIEGARRFLARGWPRVRARVPTANLRLVGKDMTSTLSASALAAGAEPVGYVEAFAPELLAAAALVVPLWAGAGARIKIVEALAARTPVVSTTLGASGLGLVAHEHVLIADDAEGLGDATATLLLDPLRAAAMAEAAYVFGRRRFSTETVARLEVERLRDAASRRRQGRQPA